MLSSRTMVFQSCSISRCRPTPSSPLIASCIPSFRLPRSLSHRMARVARRFSCDASRPTPPCSKVFPPMPTDSSFHLMAIRSLCSFVASHGHSSPATTTADTAEAFQRMALSAMLGTSTYSIISFQSIATPNQALHRNAPQSRRTLPASTFPPSYSAVAELGIINPIIRGVKLHGAIRYR